MLDVLGHKRVAFLGALLLINILLVAVIFAYIVPQKMDKSNQLLSLQRGNTTLEKNLSQMSVEFEELESQQSTFNLWKEEGFLSSQDRRTAQEILEAIQKESGVISAVVSIQAGKTVKNEDAEQAGRALLQSQLFIRVEAIDDTDVYRYLSLINQKFPGHVSVKGIELKREGELSGTILRSIAAGMSPSLVKADINLVWSSLIPQSEVIQDGRNSSL